MRFWPISLVQLARVQRYRVLYDNTHQHIQYGSQNNFKSRSEPWAQCFWKSMCACQMSVVLRDTFTYHLEEETGKVLYKYRVVLLLQIEPSEWKGCVTSGLGAGISLPHCLATSRWNLAPKVIVGPKSRGTSLGKTFWCHVHRYWAHFLLFMQIMWSGCPILLKCQFCSPGPSCSKPD